MKKHACLLKFLFLFLAAYLLTFSSLLYAQQDEVFKLEKVSGDVYCLYGPGGNIGILKGSESLLVVDSQYAGNAEGAMEEIKKLSPLKVSHLINTHYHPDHVQGNPIIGKNARIISQKNCRASFLKGLRPELTPENAGAPTETYEDEMTLRVGEETVKLLYFGPAHTSGDTVVVFEKAKVVHVGDLFFQGMVAYIDVEDGSDTQNWIVTIGRICETYPDFHIIPGHGKVTDTREFMKFADYLRYLRKEVAAAIKAGKTREEAQDSIDLTNFSHIQDINEVFNKKSNIGWVYDEMTRKKD
jgi:cyclase